MTEVTNQSRSEKDTGWFTRLNNSGLSTRKRTDLLIELTGKSDTIREGTAYMLRNPKIKFDDFEHALAMLKNANNSYSLGRVETALQTQIEVIQKMSHVDMPREKKALCLYTLQNMIFALGDLDLKNDKKNDYVPHILQDLSQMTLKGSELGMEWDTLLDSVYSSDYYDLNNSTLAEWKFLDLNLIQKNMKEFAQFQVNREQMIKQKFRQNNTETSVKSNTSVITWGLVELAKTSHVDINRILNSALVKFDAKQLKTNLPEFYNFVRDSLEEQTHGAAEIDYRILNEMAVAAMHRIVDFGSEQQKRMMMAQQNNTEGRSL